MSSSTPELQIEVTNQWNDFLVRSVDPYAAVKYNILLEWLENLQGKTALVVGSGSGEFAALLANRGAQVKAIDIDEATIALTRATAKQFNVQIETEVATLASYSSSERYDLVIATDVLEHIEDDHASAKKLQTLVQPHGKLIITVPAGPWLFGYHDEILGHFRRYTKNSIQSVLRPYFEITKIRYYGLFLIPVAWVISRWLRRPYPVAQVSQAAHRNRIVSILVRLFFSITEQISPPVGTSLLLIGRPLI